MVTLPSCRPRMRWRAEISKAADPTESSSTPHIFLSESWVANPHSDSIQSCCGKIEEMRFSDIYGADTFANCYREKPA
jgi:hypothetical protein